MKSDYSASLEAASAETPSATNLARLFNSFLVSRCYHLVKIAPGRSRIFLEAYLERFLVEDIKRILRAKRTGEAVDKNLLIAIPKGYDYVDLQAMSEASSLQDAIELMEGTRFRAVTDVMLAYRRYGLISVIEACLDKIYYDSEVRLSINGLPSQSSVEEMVGTEVDLMNIKTLMDLRARGVAADSVRKISFAPMKLQGSEVALIVEASPESLPELISRTRYADLAQPIRGALDPGKDESLDSVIRLEIYRRTRSLMIRFADTLAYVLGYIREAEAEANNLVSIAMGKELGLAESKIEATLFV